MCRDCGHRILQLHGAWLFLTDDQLHKYQKFVDTYTRVRIKEGRGSYDRATLHALPTCDRSQAMADQWRIRARSYAALKKLLSCRVPKSAKILDLGAGTGWLCNRLLKLGYRPCAIDLSIDEKDGLGAAQSFSSTWPCLQAEFDRLPLRENQVDVVIFNASFHYCVDRKQTLLAALRVLVPGGLLVILDSPIYADPASGEQMLGEQQQYFEKLIGQRSDSVTTTGYLTWEQIDEIGEDLDLDWEINKPWYGFRWALRPWLARLRGTREPATFAIVSAKAS